ncbi:MAG: exodeoxyribonuclease VII large subunit [Candidatus Kapaibacterium sp.]
MAKKNSDTYSPLFVQEEAANAPPKEIIADPQTVTSLTKAIRDLLETKFVDITVEGEISNFTHHRSGHRYWTLKDEGAQISCVFWKTRQLSYDLAEGQKVICRGRLTVYPPRGNYQLDVFQIRPIGIGALQAAFEALYKKLLSEGLFDENRKRQIPRFPTKIGIVTSPTGAALHDILTVLRRRYPLVDILLRPAAVQGVGAELEIARAIAEMNLLPTDDRPDILIVGRGGGSLEDLWAFNEEAVARAIYASKIPVISAVGHEVDVTIADFTADLRAPTPTAAAELATPDKTELLNAIASSSSSMDYLMKRRLSDLRSELTGHTSGYGLKRVLVQALSDKRSNLEQCTGSMNSHIKHFLELATARSDKFHATLQALNPFRVLERGYTMVLDDRGSVIGKAALMPKEMPVQVVFSDGKVSVRRTA